jgi:hypothetical protein
MFVERPAEEKSRIAQWLEGLARRHAGGFVLTLTLLMAVLTVGLLVAVAPPIVLYQGF